MEPQPAFTLLLDRGIAAEVGLAAWCPSMDLLALATADGQLHVHRLNWQRLWWTAPEAAVTGEAVRWVAASGRAPTVHSSRPCCPPRLPGCCTHSIPRPAACSPGVAPRWQAAGGGAGRRRLAAAGHRGRGGAGAGAPLLAAGRANRRWRCRGGSPGRCSHRLDAAGSGAGGGRAQLRARWPARSYRPLLGAGRRTAGGQGAAPVPAPAAAARAARLLGGRAGERLRRLAARGRRSRGRGARRRLAAAAEQPGAAGVRLCGWATGAVQRGAVPARRGGPAHCTGRSRCPGDAGEREQSARMLDACTFTLALAFGAGRCHTTLARGRAAAQACMWRLELPLVLCEALVETVLPLLRCCSLPCRGACEN